MNDNVGKGAWLLAVVVAVGASLGLVFDARRTAREEWGNWLEQNCERTRFDGSLWSSRACYWCQLSPQQLAADPPTEAIREVFNKAGGRSAFARGIEVCR